MEYLSSGKITSTIGIKGEVKVFNTSSFANVRYKKNSKIYVYYNDEYLELVIEKSYQKDDKFYVVKFKGINSIEEASKFKNCYLFVIKDNDILKKNQYFYADLEGLFVKNEGFEDRGVVVKVNDSTPQVSLNIKYLDKIYNVPFNDFFIKKIDIENKIIVIHFIEGLIWNL